MKKFANEEGSEEVVSDESGEEAGADPTKATTKDNDNRENIAMLLRSSFKAASEGIAKGISQDFASKQAAGSIFADIAELFIAPMLLSAPSRGLERSIKGAGGFTDSSTEVSLESKKRLQQSVISPSMQLYSSNFEPLTKVLERIPFLKNLRPLNDITNIESMAIEYKGKDLDVSMFSSESPYKIIIKEIIPILREKFDAVASFDETLGPGAKIDYEGIGQDFFDGFKVEGDIIELERFYKAIKEWEAILRAFNDSSLSLTGLDKAKPKGEEQAEGDETSADSDEGEAGQSAPIAKGIYIHSVRPGQNVDRDPNDEGLLIDKRILNSEETPVVKLFIKGEGSDDVNSTGTGEDYLDSFIERGLVSFPEGLDVDSIVSNVTRETVSGGSEVTIYFRANGIRSAINNQSIRPEIMRVQTEQGSVSLYVDDKSQVEGLRRAASSQTTPYYQAKSPSGETVYFTPADLVMSGGKIRDSKGNKFKPKNITGKSLADMVQPKRVRKKK